MPPIPCCCCGCSTPRGITGKIAVHSFQQSDQFKRAQRLAASPEKSPGDAARQTSREKRAQRLAASPEKSPCKRFQRPSGVEGAQRLAASPEKSLGKSSRILDTHSAGCSTPRGITGKIAEGFDAPCNCACGCSTPRGITGKIAPKSNACALNSASAQRLAASPEKSPSKESQRFFGIRCSTPRGITGKIAR